MRFREKIQRFFYGRNGADQLARFTNWVCIILIFVSLILSKFVNQQFGSILWWIALVLLIINYIRMLSKNIYKRQEENRKFLAVKSRIRGWFNLQRDKRKYAKDYCFFTCPSCHTVLRVPRGKGTIRIKCHKCGEAFIKKT